MRAMVVATLAVVGSCTLLSAKASSQAVAAATADADSVSAEDLDRLRAVYLSTQAGAERALALAIWEEALQTALPVDALQADGRVVPVLFPRADGPTIRCTLTPGQSDGVMKAVLDAFKDQIPISGFQAFGRGSIVRFSGVVRFPFVTRDMFGSDGGVDISGYVVRNDSEDSRTRGVTNSVLLLASTWSDSAATFTGGPEDPLTFWLLDQGLVYLHGSGKVSFQDGRTISFGD